MGEYTPHFVLTRHWADQVDGIELRYWLVNEAERQCFRITGQESSCFIAKHQLNQWHHVWQRAGVSVRVGQKDFRSLMGDEVIPIYTPSFRDQRKWVWQGKDLGLKVWEDDINPADRFLMERFIFGSTTLQNAQMKPAKYEPQLRILSIDIETSWYEPGKTPDLYSVALAGEGYQKVFVVSDDTVAEHSSTIVFCASVADCLLAVIEAIQWFDPDGIIGWNVVDFDLQVLQQHCDALEIPFSIGRDQATPRWRKRTDQQDRYSVSLEGRSIVDGPGAFRSAAWSFDDYSLETVAQTLLQRGKKIEHSDDRVGEIERMYQSDLEAFAQYNLEDAQLVLDLFEVAGLWHFLIERSHLTGLPMSRAGGSSAAFNTVYMPRLHRKGYVASSVGEQTLRVASPGGFVMDSVPGIYNDVIVLDFKSLYPSIIRTFLIDPLGLQKGLSSTESETVDGFLDAKFHRTEHILPALIDQLWQARDQAKQEKNAPMSQAIKIIMNSFYGVLGSDLCRFFDPRLASSITMRGHEILKRSREFIEAQGFAVIYGDTDSVFVHIANRDDPAEVGKNLALKLNQWWQETLQREFQLNCRLEMEFETHYKKFVMPTIRGTDKGSKKRYAGWIETNRGHQLVFKGLEAVRSDWTPLAKQFQAELYRKVFEGENYKTFIQETVQALKSGRLDDDLVYRRRLRRRIEQYEKQAPPQVQAAKLKKEKNPQWHGRTIEYVKTTMGWQPLPYVSATLDYQHYMQKQLAPIADALLHFFGEDFQSITDDQMSLF